MKLGPRKIKIGRGHNLILFVEKRHPFDISKLKKKVSGEDYSR